jgi:hypothetical protein
MTRSVGKGGERGRGKEEGKGGEEDEPGLSGVTSEEASSIDQFRCSMTGEKKRF